MDIVLGVSMAPTAIHMALVEGERADGLTLDRTRLEVTGSFGPAASDAPEQLVAAILGTLESAADGGHRLVGTGVAWSDHGSAARVRQALRAQRVEGVVLVSELHAAGALAQALGRAADYRRTALLILTPDTATLAVVRTADAAVVRLASRGLRGDALPDLAGLLAGLEAGSEAPQGLFVVGSGVDIAALRTQLAARTPVPVHAPEDGAFALARGAALAAANAPRFDASTAWLVPSDDTAAGPTQRAAARYLGYSDVADDGDGLDVTGVPDDDAVARGPALLLSGALSTILTLGVVALLIAMAVAVRPAAEQLPGVSGLVTNGPSPAPPPPETIQAPVPVVRQEPRTVVEAPPAAPPVPPPEPSAAPPPNPSAAPPPNPGTGGPVPAPPAMPAIVVPVPVVAPRLPPLFQIPGRSAPATVSTATTQAQAAPAQSPSASPTEAVSTTTPAGTTATTTTTTTTAGTTTAGTPAAPTSPATAAPVTTTEVPASAPPAGSGA